MYDYEKAEELLAKESIKVINGCINITEDKKGVIYKIPNFCINLPYFKLEILKDNGNHHNNISIQLTEISTGHTKTVELNESTKGEDIIKAYSESSNIDLNKNKIRLLFGGGIIKENETLYQHKVKNGYKIQISVSPIL